VLRASSLRPLGRMILELIVSFIIGCICGAIMSAITGGREWILAAAFLGFVGALLGTTFARLTHLPDLLVFDVKGQQFSLLWSIAGSLLVLLWCISAQVMVSNRPQRR
jgi:uncharacterized membrane protein YeaQ/YmgE (transglycosylase-associated protein family)